MRPTLLLSFAMLLLPLGCTIHNPDYIAGGVADLGGAIPDLVSPAPIPDLAPLPPDLSMGEGAPCKTACDCSPGLACLPISGGFCTKSGFGALYCCGAPSCPKGQNCEDQSMRFAKCK